MANRYNAPRPTIPAATNLNTSINFGQNSQGTSRFRPKLSQRSQQFQGGIMTVKQNHAGDTEIKFPIGNCKFIRETEKSFGGYHASSDNTYSSTYESEMNPAQMKTQTVDQNLNIGKRSKSVGFLPNKKSSVVTKSTSSYQHEKSIPRTDVLLENTNTGNTIDRKMVHLIGYVEHVIKWNLMLKNTNLHILYNVLGTFINVINGTLTLEKCVYIKGNNGTILECSFFEIDRPFPSITKGQFVGCFGQITGTQKLRLYSIQILEESERNDTQRAIFLSQRMAHELNNRKSFS